MRLISAAPIWSAKAGSSGAGRTKSPDGSCFTSRLSSSGASRRSIELTASTIVCCGVSLQHHRDVTELEVGVDEDHRPLVASGLGLLGEHDGQVGGQHRLAGATLGREDGDDLRPTAGDVGHRYRRRKGAADGLDARVRPPRQAGSCRPERPARRGHRFGARPGSRSVDSSAATRMAPTSGRPLISAAAPPRSSEREHDGPRTSTTGAPVKFGASSSTEATGIAASPSCMARRLRMAWSGSKTSSGSVSISRPSCRRDRRASVHRQFPRAASRGRRSARSGTAGSPCSPASGRSIRPTPRRCAALRPVARRR